MSKPLDIEQLIRIPSIYPWNGYALAPDGQTAAVVWDKSGQWQIYLVPLKRSRDLRKVGLIAPGAESQMSLGIDAAGTCCTRPSPAGDAKGYWGI